MSKIKKSTLYFLCSILFLTSCASLNGGKLKYHKINNLSVEKEKSTIHEIEENQIGSSLADTQTSAAISNEFNISNSAKLANAEISTYELITAAEEPEKSCDTLLMKNGKVINAKIIEIGVDIIKYKRCEFLDGPMYSVNSSDVELLTYSNGTKEVVPTVKTPPKKSKTHIVGLVLGIVGLNLGVAFAIILSQVFFFIGAGLGLLAIILAIISHLMLKKNPDAQNGRTLGAISAIVGGLSLVALTITFLVAIIF